MYELSLDGQVAIVTGAGRGIGRAIALAFAQAGADVAVASRTVEELETAAEDIRALGSSRARRADGRDGRRRGSGARTHQRRRARATRRDGEQRRGRAVHGDLPGHPARRVREVLPGELRVRRLWNPCSRPGAARTGLGLRAEPGLDRRLHGRGAASATTTPRKPPSSASRRTRRSSGRPGRAGERDRTRVDRHADEPGGAQRPSRRRRRSSGRSRWAGGAGPRRSRRPPSSCARRLRRSSPARCSSSTAARPSRARARPERVELRGAVAVVTGASSGIGESTALLLARAGAKVVLAARRLQRLEALAERIGAHGGQALPVHCDVAEPADLAELVARTDEAYARCDILVNNAGIPGGGPFRSLASEQIERVMRVNVLGVMLGTRAFLPMMLEQRRGHIVNVASLAGRFATPGSAVYAATKHAVVAFSEALYYELKPLGILVTTVESRLHEDRGFPAGRHPVSAGDAAGARGGGHRRRRSARPGARGLDPPRPRCGAGVPRAHATALPLGRGPGNPRVTRGRARTPRAAAPSRPRVGRLALLANAAPNGHRRWRLARTAWFASRVRSASSRTSLWRSRWTHRMPSFGRGPGPPRLISPIEAAYASRDGFADLMDLEHVRV